MSSCPHSSSSLWDRMPSSTASLCLVSFSLQRSLMACTTALREDRTRPGICGGGPLEMP